MVTRVGLAFFVMSSCAASYPAQVAIAQTNSAAGLTENGRLVRDPTTGKAYYQKWVTETVPTTRWENKQVTTTVFETEWVNTIIPITQTVYQPHTQKVSRPYWKGTWNPFGQPVLAYKYEPVTTWVPQNTTVNQVVPRQKVVPKQQTTTVPQLITETKTQQRLVQTEIPQPTMAVAAGSGQPRGGYTVDQPPALFSISQLARQPSMPTGNEQAWRSLAPSSSTAAFSAATTGWTAQSTTVGSGWSKSPQSGQFAAAPSTGLRPVTNTMQSILPPSSYSATAKTATERGGSWNVMQSGMEPTVLR